MATSVAEMIHQLLALEPGFAALRDQHQAIADEAQMLGGQLQAMGVDPKGALDLVRRTMLSRNGAETWRLKVQAATLDPYGLFQDASTAYGQLQGFLVKQNTALSTLEQAFQKALTGLITDAQADVDSLEDGLGWQVWAASAAMLAVVGGLLYFTLNQPRRRLRPRRA